MTTPAPTDLARALAVPCPLSWCAAFPGEECVSRTHPRLTVPPHQHRLVNAGLLERPARPATTDRRTA